MGDCCGDMDYILHRDATMRKVQRETMAQRTNDVDTEAELWIE